MKAAFLSATLLASAAHADETCHFEPILLFKADKPKATVVKLPFLIAAAPQAKPKPKRVKRFDGPRKDGYAWVCDDIEPIAETSFEQFALLAPFAEPQAPEAAMPGLEPIGSGGTPDGSAFTLPAEPTGAGVAEPEATPVLFAWPSPPLVAFGPVLYSPVTAVAEPESYALLIVGLLAVTVWRRRA